VLRGRAYWADSADPPVLLRPAASRLTGAHFVGSLDPVSTRGAALAPPTTATRRTGGRATAACRASRFCACALTQGSGLDDVDLRPSPCRSSGATRRWRQGASLFGLADLSSRSRSLVPYPTPREATHGDTGGGRWASGTPRATPTSSLAEKGARDPALRQLRARPPTPSSLLTSPGGREAEGEPSRCDIPIRRDRQSPLLLEERRPCPAGLPRALRGYARPYRSKPRYRRAPVHASIASGVPTLTGGTAPRALSLLRTRGLELPMQTRQPPPPGPRPPLRRQRDAQRRLVIGRLSCSSSFLPPLRFWPGGFLSSAHDDMSWERASQMGSPDTPRPSPRPCSGSAENTTADRRSGGSAAPEAQPAASRFRPLPLRLC